MIKKHKKFSKPKKPFENNRIKEENRLVKKYGLKNKKEVWKSEAKVKYFRSRAKDLITSDKETQEVFYKKLNKIGLKVKSIADILALNQEDILKRRLSTIISDKNLADTPKQARQMIVHKRIMVNGQIVNVPSYLVKVAEENLIELKKKNKKIKVVEEKIEEKEESEEIVDDIKTGEDK